VPDTNTQPQNNNTAGSGVSSGGMSPWDEPLPEEKTQEKIVGTLADNSAKDDAGRPFTVPTDIENKTIPTVVSANDLQSNKEPVPMENSNPDPAFNYNYSEQIQPKNNPNFNTQSPVSNSSQKPVAGALNQPNAAASQKSPSQSVIPPTKIIQDIKPANQVMPPPQVRSISPVLSPTQTVPTQAQQSITVNNSSVFTNTAQVKNAPQNAQPGDENIVETSPRKSRSFKGLFSIFIPLFAVALFIYLTEIGLISFGFERIYGAIGLERLWGGLSSNPETALFQSFVSMKDHQSFKVEGTISMSVNKTIKNSITSPLINDGTETTEESGQTKKNSNSATALPDFSVVGNGYISVSATKQINATISALFDNSGNSATAKIEQPVGSDIIDLRNSGREFWVKSDGIQFKDDVPAGDWLQLDLTSLGDSDLLSNIFEIDSAAGFSAKGIRSANEKIGDTRCYKYVFDDIEPGGALTGLGIKSDSIQKISGNIWIGIKDKLIRRIEIKITPSSSSPVLQMNTDLTFSDYDEPNAFVRPIITSGS